MNLFKKIIIVFNLIFIFGIGILSINCLAYYDVPSEYPTGFLDKYYTLQQQNSSYNYIICYFDINTGIYNLYFSNIEPYFISSHELGWRDFLLFTTQVGNASSNIPVPAKLYRFQNGNFSLIKNYSNTTYSWVSKDMPEYIDNGINPFVLSNFDLKVCTMTYGSPNYNINPYTTFNSYINPEPEIDWSNAFEYHVVANTDINEIEHMGNTYDKNLNVYYRGKNLDGLLSPSVTLDKGYTYNLCLDFEFIFTDKNR